jgi:hypothetical protein
MIGFYAISELGAPGDVNVTLVPEGNNGYYDFAGPMGSDATTGQPVLGQATSNVIPANPAQLAPESTAMDSTAGRKLAVYIAGALALAFVAARMAPSRRK